MKSFARSIATLAGLVLVLGLAACGSEPKHKGGKEADWEELGTREVDFAAERDVIKASSEGRFTKIKLGVRDHGVEILDVKVTFKNGETQDLQVRQFIEKGGETRAIDLSGEARVIQRVDLAYKTKKGSRGKGKATVIVWGRR